MNRRSLATAVLLCWAASALAVPRYSAEYGQRCALCHVDPAGGGMRTHYASMALVPEELSFLQLEPDEVARIRPDLSSAVTIGLDLRNLFYEAGEVGSGQLDMQSTVHVGVQASNQMAAYVALGKGSAREYGAVAYVLPLDGYIKAGRFTPDYGWQWADHKMASREYLLNENGFASPAALTEAGVEVGIHEQWWEATGSLLQGNGSNGESYAARLVLRRSAGPVNLALGTSILRRQLVNDHARAWGGFGYAAAGPVSWVFQVDETGNRQRQGLLVSQELTYSLMRGIRARGTYSFHDPDHQIASGSRNRWGIGFDSLLHPFIGVQLMANYHQFERGELVDQSDHWQGELVLHFLY